MLQGWVILFISFAYIGLLFAIAYYGDKRADEGRSLINNPYIYVLSLGVYCTAWTFYGSVGRAASSGVGFLPIYLGPTLMIFLGWFLLLKMTRISKNNNITSIADFVASRYGKSAILGGWVTIVLVFGVIPYISLQLKAISTSFVVLWNQNMTANDPVFFYDTALLVTIFLILFSVLFGTRHLDSTEQHEGLVAAVAFESVVKLFAFLAVGVFVTFFVHDGFSDLFAKAAADPEIRQLFTMQGTYSDWVWLMFLSMMAIFFLPRQFQMTVIENIDEKHIYKAIWLFPLYLLLINLFVLPIAISGLLHFPAGTVHPDTFVLSLPLAEQRPDIALLVYLGGLSAATSMVIVATVTLCTMISNDLVMPVLLRLPFLKIAQRNDLSTFMLTIRRLAIVAILGLSYGYIHFSDESQPLVSIGLISFAGAAQLAPVIIGGMYWKGASRLGALAGLVCGFVVWGYTLPLPLIAGAGIAPSFVEYGPWGLSFLKPDALFGLDGLSPITHSMVWSMFFNLSGFLGVSLIFNHQSVVEHAQATRFVDVFKHERIPVWRGQATVMSLKGVMARFLGLERAEELLAEYGEEHDIDWETTVQADAQLVDFVEQRLASVIGAASAQAVLASTVKEEPITLAEVMSILDESSTNYRKLSEQLRVYSEKLEEKNKALQRMDRLKDDFLANTSHELRTPLSGIIGLAESMLDGAAGDLTPPQQENLVMIVSSGRRLSTLINDILDFSKVQRKGMELQVKPMYLRSLVNAMLRLSQPLVGDKPVELINALDTDTPPISGDRNRVQQILLNLIGNAIKFTDSGSVTVTGRVVVSSIAKPAVEVEQLEAGTSLKMANGHGSQQAYMTTPNGDHSRVENKNKGIQHQGKFLAVTVTDTGIGIPLEKQERIFQAFEQADGSVSREYGGTGLGLAITQQLVELHGGEIIVESQIGVGTSFTFTLPISDKKPQNFKDDAEINKLSPMLTKEKLTENQPKAIQDGSQYHILVVDDEPVNRRVLVNQLALQNYRITTATNGLEALKLLEASEQHFDLMVLDVMMPRMSGYEVCYEARRLYPATELPIIMLTAKSQVSDLVMGLDVGANDYLTKPFSRDELLARVRTHLQLTNMRKLNASKDKFFSIVAHDLRGPFMPLLGTSELMAEMAEFLDPEQIKEMSESINRSATNVHNLLENLLQWARMQMGRIEFQPQVLDLQKIAARNIDLLSEMAKSKSVRLYSVLNESLMIYADENMIDTVIRNLTSNALKFTKEGDSVSITARKLPFEEAQEILSRQVLASRPLVEVAIVDTGVGIKPEDVDKLFKIEVHHSTKGTAKEKGTGLGLIMCKELVEKNGGEIWVESEFGEGTAVKFTVPAHVPLLDN